MIIKLTTVYGKEIVPDKISEFCFTQSLGVACDSFWAYFYSDKPVDEILRVTAEEKGNVLFAGYCDCQKTSQDENGFKIYFFARSFASVLVDNQAEPFTYNNPSISQLVFSIAKKYGFVSKLPDIASESQYEVSSGTSCYGALSQFVMLLTGDYISVNANKEIVLLTKSESTVPLNTYDALSFTHTINRSEPCSQINFKKSFSEGRYRLHTKALISDALHITREQYINLSSLPQWQRENTVLQRLKSSYSDYNIIDVTLAGYVNFSLLQRFDYCLDTLNDEDYVLTEKKYIFDKNGKRTRLILKKNIDIKEITYVD
ncbi:MAG: hypothetical protein NC397_02550 [Clostridium sp.]|nr:hypothetical protein [Clostridium sp.]